MVVLGPMEYWVGRKIPQVKASMMAMNHSLGSQPLGKLRLGLVLSGKHLLSPLYVKSCVGYWSSRWLRHGP